MNKYVNNFCLKTTVHEFKNMKKSSWTDEMISGFSNVYDGELSKSQIGAWEDSFDVLQKTFDDVPDTFGKLHIVFEYVLPKHKPGSRKFDTGNGVRPDALVLSSNTVVVIEFKGLEKRYNGCEAQARKYRRRIQEWHTESIGMNKKTALVFTKATGLNDRHFRVSECSPDMLAGILKEFLGNNPQAMTEERLGRWLNSGYNDRKAETPVKEEASYPERHLESLALRTFDCLMGEETVINISVDDGRIEKTEEKSNYRKNKKYDDRIFEMKKGTAEWLEAFNSLDIENWNEDYSDLEIIDGGSWDIECTINNGTTVKCGGNLFPDEYKKLHELIDKIK